MKTNWRLFCAAAALVAWPLAAQQSSDLSIQGGVPPDKGPSFEPHEIHGPEGLKPGPTPFTSGKPLPFFDVLPGSRPPPISPEEAEQMQKFMDNQKNWTLLTPEEIMGVPTEQSILGLPVPDDEKNLTAEQRYMKRQDAQDAAAATNSMSDASAPDGDADQQNTDDSSQNGLFGPKSAKAMTDIWGRKIKPDGTSDTDEQHDPIWNSAFTHPPAPPKPDAQQQAEMEQFRVLLGSIEPEKPAQPAHALQPVAPTPDPNLQQLPAFNPNGNSFSELKQSTYRPSGIMPLPGIATRPLENKKPESITKLPPWLSNQMPVPGTQQRVF